MQKILEYQTFFLSLSVFRLLFLSLLLFPQHFGWYVLQPSSGVCQTWEPSGNFELRPLLNTRGSPVLIPLAITGTSVKFDKHLKKAGGHIGWNVVEITMKMKTIVPKHLMIKIIKLRLRNLDNSKSFIF